MAGLDLLCGLVRSTSPRGHRSQAAGLQLPWLLTRSTMSLSSGPTCLPFQSCLVSWTQLGKASSFPKRAENERVSVCLTPTASGKIKKEKMTAAEDAAIAVSAATS